MPTSSIEYETIINDELKSRAFIEALERGRDMELEKTTVEKTFKFEIKEIQPLFILQAKIEDEVYKRKIFEYELVEFANQNEIGTEMTVTIPMEVKNKVRASDWKIVDFEEVLVLVGYDEENYYVKINIYQQGKLRHEQLVMVNYND